MSRGSGAYDYLPDAVLVADRQGRIVYANKLAGSMLGLPESELIGVAVEELVPERHREGYSERMAEFFAAPGRLLMGSGRPVPALRCDGREIAAEVWSF